MIVTETVFIGRDNVIDIQLYDDSVVRGVMDKTSLANATRVEIIIDDGAKYNSEENADIISYSYDGIVNLKLGKHFKEENIYNAQIVVFDPSNLDGILWEPKIVLDVKTDSF